MVDQRCQFLSDLIQRKYLFDGPGSDGGPGHAEMLGGRFILYDHPPAIEFDALNTISSICIATCKHCTDRFLPEYLGIRFKQWRSRSTGTVFFTKNLKELAQTKKD